MRHALTLSAAAACIAIAAPASAAVIIYDSPGDVQPDQNVLFQAENQTGTTVEGVTNQTNTNVTFTSDEDLTVTGSEGQARIEGDDDSLDSLTVSLTNPLLTFTEFEFNLFNALSGTDEVTITYTLNGVAETFTLGNGQNFFGIRATEGDVLTSVSFQTNGTGVQDVRQVRIGGIASPTGAIPEPGTWAMMLFGFGAIGFAMRRRRKDNGARVRLSYS